MRIIMHIGLPKTGSSALQYSFDTNRDRLAKVGVHYAAQRTAADAAPTGISSGNGGLLSLHIVKDERRPGADIAELPRLFDRTYVDPRCGISLISNEALARADTDGLRRFRDETVRDRDLMVIAYVRDLYGHARSSWMQGIKRGGYGEDLQAFVENKYGTPQTSALRRYHRVFGDRLKVLHYDSNRKDIVPSFLNAAGLELGELQLGSPIINRSLSREEIDVMLEIHPLHKDRQFSQLLTDGLIARHPERQSFDEVDWSIVEDMKRRFSADVDWVNETFFGGQPVLKVEPAAAAQNSPAHDLTASVWKDVVDILINEIREMETSPRGTLRSRRSKAAAKRLAESGANPPAS